MYPLNTNLKRILFQYISNKGHCWNSDGTRCVLLVSQCQDLIKRNMAKVLKEREIELCSCQIMLTLVKAQKRKLFLIHWYPLVIHWYSDKQCGSYMQQQISQRQQDLT